MSEDTQYIYHTQTSGDYKIARVKVNKVTPKLYHIGRQPLFEILFNSSQYGFEYLSVGVQLPKDSPDVHLTIESAIQRIMSIINLSTKYHNEILQDLRTVGNQLEEFASNLYQED